MIIILLLFLCVIEKTTVTHHNSKITGAVCPAVDLPEIKASSKKCCSRHIDIYRSEKIILYSQLHV